MTIFSCLECTKERHHEKRRQWCYSERRWGTRRHKMCRVFVPLMLYVLLLALAKTDKSKKDAAMRMNSAKMNVKIYLFLYVAWKLFPFTFIHSTDHFVVALKILYSLPSWIKTSYSLTNTQPLATPQCCHSRHFSDALKSSLEIEIRDKIFPFRRQFIDKTLHDKQRNPLVVNVTHTSLCVNRNGAQDSLWSCACE